MRLLVQRVLRASVSVGEERVAAMGPGLLCLVGFGAQDGPDLPATALWGNMLDKLLNLRVFPDILLPGDAEALARSPEALLAARGLADKMQRSVGDIGGEVLLVPQFTLYANCARGRRPDFTQAAPPDVAAALFARCVADVASRLQRPPHQGVFAAAMQVSLCNWGPVTILLDSDALYGAATPV